MDEVWVRVIIIVVTTTITATLGSGGFWLYLQKRDSDRNATTKLMMGLAYSELTKRGEEYMSRGWVSIEEFEDFLKYFYKPYVDLGGNGVAEKIANDVKNLPMRRQYDFRISDPHEGYINNVQIAQAPSRSSIE